MIQSTVYIQQKHKDEIIVYVHVFHVFYGSSHQNRHHFQQKFWMAFGFGEHPCVVKPFKNPGEAKTLGLTNTRTECQTIRHPDVCWSFWRGWAILDRSGGLCVFLIKIAKRNTGPSLGSPIFCEKKRDFEVGSFSFWICNIQRSGIWDPSKWKKSKKKIFKPIWLKLEVFSVQKLLYW